jgi:5-hydroxyisourate hydrolase
VASRPWGSGSGCNAPTATGGPTSPTGRPTADGRIGDLVPSGELTVGVHRLTFDTAGYCDASGETCFFPEVTVTFAVTSPDDHHHVPLLLSPYGYSTYRGS